MGRICVGFIANTLILRLDLSGNPTFRELLRRAKRICLEAYAHQELPYVRVVQELNIERDAFTLDLVRAMVTFQDDNLDRLELEGCTATRTALASVHAKFDLTITFVEGEEAVAVQVEFSRSAFDESSIRCLLEQFGKLLGGVAANPDARLSELPLVGPEERRTLLAASGPAAPRPFPRWLLHRRLERQASATPDAVAMVCGEQQVTYEALNREANRLARYLRGYLRGGERLVGVLLDPGVELMVGLLAVLKAGGAYVPLDPATRASGWPHCSPTPATRCCITRARRGSAGAPGMEPAAAGPGSPRRSSRADHRETQAPVVGRTPRLRHLHLRLHRPAQGRAGHPRQRGAPVRRPPTAGSASAPDDVWTLFHSLRLRLLGLGDVGRAAARRPAGGGAATDRAASPEEFWSCWRASGSPCSTRRRRPSAS